MINKPLKNTFGNIQSLYVGKERGTAKKLVDEVLIKENYGIVDDIHAEQGKHQISLLAEETIIKFEALNTDIGKFEANIIIKGIEMDLLHVGTKLKVGDCIIIEINQIGKDDKRIEDHYLAMYRAGVFATVIKGGKAVQGDKIEVLS